MNTYIEKQLENIKENPKIKGALEVFECAQKIYDKSMKAMTPKYIPKFKGSYSSSISEKNYYANISTTTRWT